MAQVQFADRLLKEAPMGHWAIGPVNGIPRKLDFSDFRFYAIIWISDFGCGTVCMPDDSNKAWGMLFESEAWPLPFRVK